MKKIIIVGSGPSALLLAAFLDEQKFDIHMYDKNAAAGRKFLVAGDGGFNLTHSENIETFITRYTPEQFLKESLLGFANEDLRAWLNSIGIPTYVGSSKRVFPEKGIKPIEVLNAVLDVLKKKNVHLHFNCEWKGWKENALLFSVNGETSDVSGDEYVFALGGASWKVTGSNGSWTNYFAEKNIQIVPFEASNCAMKVDWKNEFIKDHEGKALKNIAVKCGDKMKKGELVITKFGLEGGAVYFHSPEIRRQLHEHSFGEIRIDLKPDELSEQLITKLKKHSSKNRSSQLKEYFHFDSTTIALLKSDLSKDDFLSDEKLVAAIKNFPLRITGLAPIDEAISTAGGISLTEVNVHFELKKLPHHFVIGEMLDWDAPTGGYLLQGCFSMGVQLACWINASQP